MLPNDQGQALAADAVLAPPPDGAPWQAFTASGVLPRPHHAPEAEPLPFEARKLGAADVDAVYALHLEVIAEMRQPGLVRKDSRDYFAAHMEEAGFILGAFADGRLVGYGLSSFPRDAAENYGVVLGLPEDELAQVGQLEGAAVGSAYWGRGLHRRLAAWRTETLVAAGYRHICATVAPGNVWSLRNLLRNGLVIRKMGLLYGGLLRFVLQRDQQHHIILDPSSRCVVPLADHDRQQALMAHGYVGHGCITHGPGDHSLIYSRPEAA